MLKMFAFIFLAFSQTSFADSDVVYRCGKNTYQSMPCAYTKDKVASQKPENETQPIAEKPLKDTKKISTANKPKPLAIVPKTEPTVPPTKTLPVITKNPPVAVPPAPKPAPKPTVEPIVETPASKSPVALPEPAPAKAPEPVATPEPTAPPLAIPEPVTAPVATPEPVAEPTKAQEAPTKTQEELGVCDSLKSGLDNIAKQRKSGAGDAADLNRQQKELENIMKQSGC